jgi:hypothetical protein
MHGGRTAPEGRMNCTLMVLPSGREVKISVEIVNPSTGTAASSGTLNCCSNSADTGGSRRSSSRLATFFWRGMFGQCSSIALTRGSSASPSNLFI